MPGYEIPTGLVGIRPRDPIGCHVSMAIRGERGAPEWKGRFFLTTQETHSESFTSGSGKGWSALTRSLHGSFVAWNNAAFKLGEEVSSRKGPGRLGTLRGNLIHARWQDAARWNRAAQKLGEGHPSPRSRKPACEGNGITALRFRGIDNGREVFETIACPNRECPFAEQGLCKPSAHLIFRLRWDTENPEEAKFPALVAEWSTRGWESLENMVGLLELVVGTEALLPEESRRLATPEQREKWKSGLAAELGIREPSLVGMPFVMTVAERTRQADEKSRSGKRFPVVNFSPDGDLVAWLLNQSRSRKELSALAVPAGLLPAAVTDHDFLEVARHESRVELDLFEHSPADASPTPDGPESQGKGGGNDSGLGGEPSLPPSETPGVPAESSGSETLLQGGDAGAEINPHEPTCGDSPGVSPGPVQVVEDLKEPALLPAVKVEGLYKLADRYKVARFSLESYAAEKFGSGSLESLPATFEGDLMKWIAAEGERLKKGARR